MYHQWNWITFVHRSYPPAVVQRLLPSGLTVQTSGGTAWVGLTPFLMEGVRAPAVPAVPWLSRFGEVNVRTYVRDGRDRSGIWFFSLDASRLPAVLAARAGYRLPYFWSDVDVTVTGGRIGYRCRRRYPAGGTRCDAEVAMGPPLAKAERDEFVHFLTARYRLFTVIAASSPPPRPNTSRGRCIAPECSAWIRICCRGPGCQRRPVIWRTRPREYQCGSACGTGDPRRPGHQPRGLLFRLPRGGQ
jgi:uncharacterized protein YqjF (DUF2071 family)